jgi:hypothetical protein
MSKPATRRGKIRVAVLCGLLTGVMAAMAHLLMMPFEKIVILHALIGDLIAALTAVVVCLGIQLRHEEVHYRTAIERAAIVAELNHHIRNAVFPLSLAVHRTGDAEAVKAAQEAVERINIALKDATADALSGQTQYVRPETAADETANSG